MISNGVQDAPLCAWAVTASHGAGVTVVEGTRR